MATYLTIADWLAAEPSQQDTISCICEVLAPEGRDGPWAQLQTYLDWYNDQPPS